MYLMEGGIKKSKIKTTKMKKNRRINNLEGEIIRISTQYNYEG